MYDVVHIGYQKCGSTFLQKSVFPSYSEIQLTLASDFVQGLMYYDDPVYQKYCLDDTLGGKPSFSGEFSKIRVLSSETFTHRYHTFTRVADRLQKLSPSAKIFVVVRNQQSFLRSAYMHRVLWGHGCSFEKFTSSLAMEDGALYGISYYRYLSEYLSRFERVKIVLFEQLFQEQILKDVMEFVGVEDGPLRFDRKIRRNANYSPFTHELALIINKYSGTKGQYFDPMEIRYYNFLRRFGHILDKAYYKFRPNSKLELPGECVSYIQAYYAKDNEKLQTLFDFDIREYGYHY